MALKYPPLLLLRRLQISVAYATTKKAALRSDPRRHSIPRQEPPPPYPFCSRAGDGAMPLEISETFSTAPLSGRWRDPEFVIPRDMQLMLISEFESLGNEYNIYSDAERKAARFGPDMFKSTLDESKGNLRAIRDKAVQLMKKYTMKAMCLLVLRRRLIEMLLEYWKTPLCHLLPCQTMLLLPCQTMLLLLLLLQAMRAALLRRLLRLLMLKQSS